MDMRARRSAGERKRAAVGAWMPLDGRKAGLLAVGAILMMIVAAFLH